MNKKHAFQLLLIGAVSAPLAYCLSNDSKHAVFISIASNIGTIFALLMTVKSNDELRTTNQLKTFKEHLDNSFSELSLVLDGAVFYHYTSAGAEMHIGKAAYYRVRSQLGHFNHMFHMTSSFTFTERYLERLRELSKKLENTVILPKEDPDTQYFYSRLRVEVYFLEDEIIPVLDHISKQQFEHATLAGTSLSKAKALKDSIEQLLKRHSA